MAYINKRGDGYVVRYTYTDAQGRRRDGWENYRTEKEAKQRKQQVEVEMHENTFLAPSTMTVQELLERWLPLQSGKHKWAPKTYEATKANIQNHIVPYLGTMRVQEVRAYHIEQLYETLRKTPCGLYKHGAKQELTEKQQTRFLSGTTLNEIHGILRSAFYYATEWDLIHKSPIPRDAPKRNTKERAIWSSEMVAEALDSIEDEMLHLAVHLTFIGSLRAGEVLGITPHDLDFDGADGRGKMEINKALQRVGKDALKRCDPDCILRVFPDQREGSGTALVLKTTKNKNSVRHIFMTEPLKAELRHWLEKLAREETDHPDHYENSGMLFRFSNGHPVEQTYIRKKFESWQAAHPEYNRIVFHALRHSSATYQLVVSGGDIKSVQGNTGHATAGILVNTYAHIQEQGRLELSDKMAADFYRHTKASAAAAPREACGAPLTCESILQALRSAEPETRKKLALALLA